MATVTARRGPIHAVTVQATAALTGGRFVSVTADNTGPGLNTSTAGESNIQVAHTAAGAASRGVLAFDLADNGIGTCFDSGTIPVESGGTIAAGAKVMAGANGVAVAWATAASEANECLGTCEDGVTVGQYALIKLNVA